MTQMQTKPPLILPSLNMAFDAAAWPESDNCFTYALNLKGSGYRRPGQLIKPFRMGAILNKGVFHLFMERNGFRRVDQTAFIPSQHHVIAAFIDNAPYGDFHFARLDGDGTWSHKSGSGGYPSKFTRTGNPPADIGKIGMPHYSVFVGYYKIPETGIQPRIK